MVCTAHVRAWSAAPAGTEVRNTEQDKRKKGKSDCPERNVNVILSQINVARQFSLVIQTGCEHSNTFPLYE